MSNFTKMNNKKQYKIGDVELTMQPNGFPQGFILLRELTVRETMHILQKILGFANETYKYWFEYPEEIDGYRQQCRYILTEFLKGNADWECLCNETQCYDDDNMGFPFASAFPLVNYLKKKGIVSRAVCFGSKRK